MKKLVICRLDTRTIRDKAGSRRKSFSSVGTRRGEVELVDGVILIKLPLLSSTTRQEQTIRHHEAIYYDMIISNIVLYSPPLFTRKQCPLVAYQFTTM